MYIILVYDGSIVCPVRFNHTPLSPHIPAECALIERWRCRVLYTVLVYAVDEWLDDGGRVSLYVVHQWFQPADVRLRMRVQEDNHRTWMRGGHVRGEGGGG